MSAKGGQGNAIIIPLLGDNKFAFCCWAPNLDNLRHCSDKLVNNDLKFEWEKVLIVLMPQLKFDRAL